MTDRTLFRAGLAVLVACLVVLGFIFVALADDAHGQDPEGAPPVYCEFGGQRPEVRWTPASGGHAFYYSAETRCHPYSSWTITRFRQITRLESRRPGGTWSTYSRPIASHGGPCPYDGTGWCGNTSVQLDRCDLGREGREYRSKQKTIFYGHRRADLSATFQRSFTRYRSAPMMWACGSYEP